MTASAEIEKLTRAYFALCRKSGMSEDARHQMNLDATGKRSWTEFSLTERREMVAGLQRANGQADVQPGRPHLRGQRPEVRGQRSGASVALASAAQVALIEELASRVHFYKSLDAFIRGRILPLPLRALRWDGRLESLAQAEATKTILVLRKMTRLSPRPMTNDETPNDERSPKPETRNPNHEGSEHPAAVC